MIDGFKADVYSLGISMLSLMFPKAKSPFKLVENLNENIKIEDYIYKDLMMII